jgi:two-component system response regulator TctD
MRLILVEDNEELSGLLVDAFRAAGYDTDVVATASEARAVLLTTYYAALVLDLGLPDGDGLSIIYDIRARNIALPILILTARGGIHDRVKGLGVGADDYLVKPFATEELIARLQALLRRFPGGAEQSLKLANLELITENGINHLIIGGQPQTVSPRDLTILEILLQRQGRVVSKTLMADQITKGSSGVGPNAIEVYVHRLRKVLQGLGARVSIETVRGVGYMIRERQDVQR